MSDIETTAVIVHQEALPSLLAGESAHGRARDAEQISMALKPVIERNKLFVNIGGRKHVLVEGWTTLGALVGVFPATDWVRETETGFEARVEARTLAGAVVGAAIAECSREEKRWKTADRYAIKSMAQTRATSKALRMPLGFIMTLSGYEPTPAEEMDGIQSRRNPKEADAERAELQKLLQRWVTEQGGPEAVIKLLGDNELPDVVSSVLTVTPDNKLAPVLGNLSGKARENLSEYLRIELGE